MFLGLPPSNKDEWPNLKDFVAQYNYEKGTNFTLVKALDKLDSTQSQPEVLLQDGDSKMVIERKIFPWPPDNIRHHQLWHDFNQIFLSQALTHFSDDIYVLEIDSSDIPGNRRETIDLADYLVKSILANRNFLLSHNGMEETESPKWRFFRLEAFEYNDEYDEPGIIIRLKNSFKSYSPQEFNLQEKEIIDYLIIPINRTVPKFRNYSDCLRILIIELYSNVLSFNTTRLSYILNKIPIPKEIDQVWIAESVEIDDNQSHTIYYCV